MRAYKPLILCGCLSLLFQAHAVDIQELVEDTQQVNQSNDAVSMVWWIPTEFWIENFKQDPTITEQQGEAFVATLVDYTVFAVVNAKAGTFGGLTPKTKMEIEENSQLKVNGVTLPLLSEGEISSDAANFFVMMKPLMGQMLGQFGQGMEFLVYSDKNARGERILDPSKSGEFVYSLFGDEFSWRLPLGSMLPPRFDRETGEKFPGNYKYNPYTGDELITK